MSTVGLVGAGAMGSALGAGWIEGGHRVLTCLADRSERTRRLVEDTGVRTVATLDDVMARSDVVISVVPPGDATDAAEQIADAARRTAATPLVADLNAVAPQTVEQVRQILAVTGCDVVDGAISGGPPRAVGESVRVYLAGDRAAELVALANPRIDAVILPGAVGAASALKMCTASMYKGTKALVMQALLTAEQHGVREQFLADCARVWPDDVPAWPGDVAIAASKAWRFVAEMEQIALTQAGAGLPPELFQGVAAAYARAAQTPLGQRAPEEIDRQADVREVLAGLWPADAGALSADGRTLPGPAER